MSWHSSANACLLYIYYIRRRLLKGTAPVNNSLLHKPYIRHEMRGLLTPEPLFSKALVCQNGFNQPQHYHTPTWQKWLLSKPQINITSTFLTVFYRNVFWRKIISDKKWFLINNCFRQFFFYQILFLPNIFWLKYFLWEIFWPTIANEKYLTFFYLFCV